MVRCSFQGIHLLNTVNDVLTLLCQRCPGTAPAARKHEGADQEALVREQRRQARSGLGIDAVWVRAGRGTTGAAVQDSASRRGAPVSRTCDGRERSLRRAHEEAWNDEACATGRA